MARTKNCGRCNRPKSQCNCGRPSKFTEETIQKLKQAFANTCTDQEACAYAGVSMSALYEYQKRYPKFQEEKEALKMRPNISARSTIVKNLIDIDTAKWWAERKIRQEFATRHEITGEDGEAIKLETKVINDIDKIYGPNTNSNNATNGKGSRKS